MGQPRIRERWLPVGEFAIGVDVRVRLERPGNAFECPDGPPREIDSQESEHHQETEEECLRNEAQS